MGSSCAVCNSPLTTRIVEGLSLSVFESLILKKGGTVELYAFRE